MRGQRRVGKMRASLAAAAALWVAALCAVGVAASDGDQYACLGSSDAMAALQSNDNITVQHTEGVGYVFVISPALVISLAIPGYAGGPNLTRGVVIFPEEALAPQAYAPLARGLALSGTFVVVLDEATPGGALRAMMQRPLLEFWTVVGHGRGGALAARLALTLQPKVKALILLAEPMPKDVDMAGINIYVVALYGQQDRVVTPASVEESTSRMPGDAAITVFPHLGHHDFAMSECVDQGRLTERDLAAIIWTVVLAVMNNQWAAAGEKALSFSDNKRLTPGLNISKPYPGDIRVHFTQAPIPDTTPQRSWSVFTPTEIKGGLVYLPGASVDARAYFPIAFEIAARGHLVVVVEIQLRAAPSHIEEANKVIDSTLPLVAGVPKGRWAVGGHSFGGQATSLYVEAYGDKIYAAVMHAGLWATNLTENPLPIVQIYGSIDGLAGDHTFYKSYFVNPPPKGIGPLVNLKTTKFVTIEGANHYQTGDYGYQKPDEIATISMEQQVSEFAKATVAFLDDVASLH